ncbi:hypothetical protein [Micromonospora endolithica]|uniref:hypothetical protein n=1 Tax=Micromonospora endolithica TaxID=230091 RepID=UPI0011AD5E56|nr:hypothetical protein [Micromonospora endolithica]TWJ24200.1 hypothetical protein JD76_04348 [Micromonospora endolithica]
MFSLAIGLAVAAVPGLAAAAPTLDRVVATTADPVEPGGEPGTEPTGDPGGAPPTTPPIEPEPLPTSPPPTEPETSPPPPPTTDPAPTTTAAPPAPVTTAPTTAAPTTAAPAPPPPAPPVSPGPPVPPAAPVPGAPPASPLGVQVTTGDLTLTPAYWNAPSTVADLRVTIANTGRIAQEIRLGYTLPAGVTDAGTPGCAATGGGGYRCGAWTSEPGARFSTTVRVRIDGQAWRQMPLSGSVQVTANAPGGGDTVSDNEGFALLFPPGPPIPGIRLKAGEVAFDISGTTGGLDVELGNTGTVDAAGGIEVILPSGVTVAAPPAGCVVVDPTRTRCDLGTVAAGRTAVVRLPVAATPEAQRDAPLAGAVVGKLDPRSGPTRQVQMTFRITAVAALATPAAYEPAPTGSQGVLAAGARSGAGGGMSSVQRTAVVLIVVSTLLVVLALALATTSLRRRMTGGTTSGPAIGDR